jgi:ubiquinone biosynthesis protein
MIRSIRNLARLVGLARLLSQYDALFALEQVGAPHALIWLAKRLWGRTLQGRPGERLAQALQKAGPSFIKLGQALSTRSDLLGEEIAADLSSLQDRLPPFSGAAARKAITAEFGQPVEDLFESFNEESMAAASIAQVHFARTKDGQDVAVKILRPDIEIAFARDIDLFQWLAELAEEANTDLKRLRPLETVRTIAETVTLEMDLRYEAAAAAELAENFEGDETFHVPAVDWKRTGRRILTTEWVNGIPLNDRTAIVAAGHDPLAILAIAANSFFLQVFRDGFFHGDLHPGNLFVRKDSALVAVDFGIMGRINRQDRRHLAALLLAFMTGNYRRAAEVHFDAGWIPSTRSIDAFTQACRSIGEPILDKPQNEISIARLLAQLFQVSKSFQMEAQPQLLLLQKTMLVAEGSGRLLAPEANIWLLARPLIEKWGADNLSPEAHLHETAQDIFQTLQKLPIFIDNVGKITQSIAGGGVRLHPDTIQAMRAGQRTQWGRRISLVMLAIAALFLLS